MPGQAVLTRPEQASQIEKPARLDGMNVNADADSRQQAGHPSSGGENLVEKGLGLVLVRLLSQR